MLPETNEPTQFSNYALNWFDEPRDHANLWDVSLLWPDYKPEPRDEKQPSPNPTPVVKA